MLKTEQEQEKNDRYQQKDQYLLIEKCLKCVKFCALAFELGKKCQYDENIFLCETFKMESEKNR